MRCHTSVIVSLVVIAGFVTQARAAGTLVATADNRSGTIQAYINHGGDPIQDGYNIVPGENEFLPINFNSTVSDPDGSNTATAMLHSQSSYVGFNSVDHSFTSLSVNSTSSATLHIVNAPDGNSHAQDYVSMGIHVQGLTGAQRVYVRLSGTVAASGGGTASVQFTGPGVSVTFGPGPYNQVLTLRNGDYIFLGQSTIQYSHSGPVSDSGTASFTASLVRTTAGDLNCDGVVNFADINPFVLALQGFNAYHAQFPNCNFLNADINGDGSVNFADINPFVAMLQAS